ncbi:histidine phosphatase family protein [Sulfuricurvum sp.]|uniref:SixA phosphatase family protein n=1 Tax=Sulfuricurvum sp. TaxID=2025608 RepID=UPI00261437BF|nr:histidine phosphatase family protein [Sulfuricurvum sp.]MDD2266744.1 histidine phosphatase family protein [Sulfuricurvum sp.]MDD2783912.1 histidine phosphatase family protein [Sulfuricurvum sp.]
MKTLILIRHAKSDWSNPFLHDFDRELNARGLKDAPLMGTILAQKNIHPDLILSSPALRAQATAIEIARKLSFPEAAITYDSSLYESDIETVFKVIRSVPDTCETLILFGHNPEMTECVNALCDAEIDNVPTCGVVAMRLRGNSWKSIEFHSANLLFFDAPKHH